MARNHVAYSVRHKSFSTSTFFAIKRQYVYSPTTAWISRVNMSTMGEVVFTCTNWPSTCHLFCNDRAKHQCEHQFKINNLPGHRGIGADWRSSDGALCICPAAWWLKKKKVPRPSCIWSRSNSSVIRILERSPRPSVAIFRLSAEWSETRVGLLSPATVNLSKATSWCEANKHLQYFTSCSTSNPTYQTLNSQTFPKRLHLNVTHAS